MQPLVSIGMPILNCEKTLIPAVQSILNQTYSNWELFLIDDGSTDKTLEIARSFKDSRIQIIADGLNQQLSNRLNEAICMSKGKYFARMDGDDISYPERLEIQVEYLENHPDIDLMGTGMIVFGKDGNSNGKFSETKTHTELCSSPWNSIGMSHPTWMGRLEWFRNFQYRPEAIRIEDQDILLRSYQQSRFAVIPNVLLGYRVESVSLKKTLLSRYYHSIILLQKAVLDKNFLFFYGASKQAAKALVDIFAIVTGLNLKILKHRLGSNKLDIEELNNWQQIWTKCISEDAVSV